MVVLSHLHYDHAGGAELFPKSELIVQKDEYTYAHYPASFFESSTTGRTSTCRATAGGCSTATPSSCPGVTVLRTDGHTPATSRCWSSCPRRARSFSPGTPATGMEHVDKERVPGVVWNPTLALHSIKRLKTLARLMRGAHLSGSRPGLLGNREAGAGRLPLSY